MSIQIKTQILVLGAGPGGYSAAFRCADLGMEVTIIERYPNLGGVCLNVGCIPSKTLLHIAKLIKTHKNMGKYGLIAGDIHIDINKIRTWKNNVINQLSNGLNHIAKKRNVRIIHGTGKFINCNSIQIENHDITTTIIFDYAIIASGSYPIKLPFIPDNQHIWDSTDALALNTIPKKLLIVGSGAIGLEMATIYHAFGSEVSIIESCNQIIPSVDKDIVDLFTKTISKDINLITNTKINSVNVLENHINVITENNITSTKNSTHYDALLIAIGRAPNTSTLNIQNIGIHTDQTGYIIVDKQMRTNIKNIFAIGDSTGKPMLAHKSIHEGRVAAEVISGKKRYFDPKIIPSIIYTDPEIAWVGYTEKDANDKNINYEIATFPWIASGRAITSDCTNGITKLVFDKKTHRIIGGSVLGSHADEILGEISLAIEMGCDVEDISLTIHAHPTLHESIASAASIYDGSITDLINTKKQQ